MTGEKEKRRDERMGRDREGGRDGGRQAGMEREGGRRETFYTHC